MNTRRPHLTDAELLQALDDTGSDPDPRVRDHLDGCDRCARALDTLRDESRLIHDWLHTADFEERDRPLGVPRGLTSTRGAPSAALAMPPDHTRVALPTSGPLRTPPHRSDRSRTGRSAASPRSAPAPLRTTPPWLKAAAILVLLAAPLAAIPAVRAWVSGQLAAPQNEAAEAAPALDAPTIVRFAPDAGLFTVRFAAGATGSLTVDPLEGDDAIFRAPAGADAVVAPSSLDVRTGADAPLALGLPAGVESVRVRVGAGERMVTRTEIEAGVTIPLGEI